MTLAQARARANKTFIVQVPIAIVAYDCQNIFTVQATGFFTRLKSVATFCRILSNSAKALEHFNSKFIQNGYWVEFRLKIGFFWGKNTTWLHFIHFHSYKLIKNMCIILIKT
jgi:hypothetical protein